ncbi:MAG: PaaI family thioesterase [Desulfobacterales bacterium]
MKALNPAYIEELKKVVKNSPYPRHMAMVLAHIELDRAEIALKLASYHLQPFGIVHGGVIATMIDTATFWSAFLRLPEDAGLVNVDLKLNYLQPVVDGILTARANCLRAGRSISYSEAKVFDESENLVAHGTSTLMVLQGKGLQLNAKKFLEE